MKNNYFTIMTTFPDLDRFDELCNEAFDNGYQPAGSMQIVPIDKGFVKIFQQWRKKGIHNSGTIELRGTNKDLKAVLK